ncbi:hypothetical protein PRIPAC_77644 [Pristionchus pacificus]|nr:hypothetical protein PRIPAC_77644 [Pristionchus pacificus]|eukprot:PDM71058.1 hypothetical protein PRIPAC_44454 [Pristionchus pacificus]
MTYLFRGDRRSMHLKLNIYVLKNIPHKMIPFLLVVASGSLSILSDGELFLLIPLVSANDTTRSQSPSKPDWSPCDGIQARTYRSKIDFRVWRTRAHRRIQHTPGFVFDLSLLLGHEGGSLLFGGLEASVAELGRCVDELEETLAGLARKLLGVPSGSHTLESLSAGNTDGVDHLVLGEDLVDEDLQTLLSPLDLVGDGPSVELDLHNVGLLVAWDTICEQLRQQSYREPREQGSFSSHCDCDKERRPILARDPSK